MTFSVADHAFMARALQLAALGLNTTTPNPRVGCVLADGETIVGEGWHEKAGRPHAEVHALRMASGATRGATAYVTLEPCSHHGRTPPCADALIASGIARVVVAMTDPNPLVAGQGLARLSAAGITVETGLLEAEAHELNIGFVARMTHGRPWTRLKIAASLDGRTALNNGKSQWITGPEARRDVHAWRARSCAVLTGSGTVRDDNPRLNVREIPAQRQPKKIIVDSRLEIETDAAALADGNALVACAVEMSEKMARLHAAGVDTVILPNAAGMVDLPELMRELARRGINEVLVEAGRRLNGALLQAGCVDELLIYQAPLLLGESARGMADLGELTDLMDGMRLAVTECRRVGPDLRLRARLA